jgi:hypothetical protein
MAWPSAGYFLTVFSMVVHTLHFAPALTIGPGAFYLRACMDFKSLFGAKPAAPLGSGMVQQAAQIMQSRPYQLHVAEAKAMGQQPMSPEQFLQQMQPKGLLSQ